MSGRCLRQLPAASTWRRFGRPGSRPPSPRSARRIANRPWDAAISAALHVAALAALLTWATPVTETASPEPVTIEIVADTPQSSRSASLEPRRSTPPPAPPSPNPSVLLRSPKRPRRRPSSNPLPLRSRKRPRRRPSPNPLPLRSRKRPRRRPSPNPLPLRSRNRPRRRPSPNPLLLRSRKRPRPPVAEPSPPPRGSAATQAGRRADAAALAPRRVPRRHASRSRCRAPRRESRNRRPPRGPLRRGSRSRRHPKRRARAISREPPETSTAPLRGRQSWPPCRRKPRPPLRALKWRPIKARCSGASPRKSATPRPRVSARRRASRSSVFRLPRRDSSPAPRSRDRPAIPCSTPRPWRRFAGPVRFRHRPPERPEIFRRLSAIKSDRNALVSCGSDNPFRARREFPSP